MLRVASVCTPCYMLLRVVGCYCIRLHTSANTDATSHLLGLKNSSIRIKLKSFGKVASSLFTIWSLDSPHQCYQDFYTWVASPTGSLLSIPTTLEPERYYGKMQFINLLRETH